MFLLIRGNQPVKSGQVGELSKLVCRSIAKKETSILRRQSASTLSAVGRIRQGPPLFEEETPPTNLPSEHSVVLSYAIKQVQSAFGSKKIRVF